MKNTFGKFAAFALLSISLILVGCDTAGGPHTNVNNTPPNAVGYEVLKNGDLVTILFSDLPVPTAPLEERVKDDGTITLVYNQTFMAAGKTRGALEREIRERYVPSYYLNLTVTVKLPEQFYYVDGEVKMPSRQPHPGEMSVLKAIASAQGFTDFANKHKVRVTRANGQTFIEDCVAANENPQLDLPVYPNDKVHVARRW
jgi:polysaccharide export outer membrane protein